MHRVRLKGAGRAELAAYGLADAEHQVQKELRAALPGAHVDVLDVSRAGGDGGRIVEEFAVGWRVSLSMDVAADSVEASRREALRRARELLAVTRYDRVRWEVEEEGGEPAG